MKIVHINLTGSYNRNWNYQDNLLPAQNVKDGYDVLFIATTYVNDKNSEGYLKESPGEFAEKTGVRVVRLENPRFLPECVQKKVRTYPALLGILERERPDIILFHGTSSLDLLKVARYKKLNPNVKLFCDCHASAENSASSFLSRKILHGMFYKSIVRLSKKYVDKFFYVAYECRDFLERFYSLDEKKDRLEFFSLGGTPPEPDRYALIRSRLRQKYFVKDGDVVFLHAGKLGRGKKTVEAIEAFLSVKKENKKLLIAGSFSDDIKDVCLEYVRGNPETIIYAGWLGGDDLVDHMCASDVLLLPGTQTVIIQQGICTHLAVILGDYENNRFLIKDGNGFIVKDEKGQVEAMAALCGDSELLEKMRRSADVMRDKELSYAALAKKMYE